METIDFNKDQMLFSIRKNNDFVGYIETVNGKLTTSGAIGENQYDNFVELLKGLQGHDISFDNLYW
jgi:hypothetical protein